LGRAGEALRAELVAKSVVHVAPALVVDSPSCLAVRVDQGAVASDVALTNVT